MGCGAGVKSKKEQPANDEQMKAVCGAMGRQMLILAVNGMLDRKAEVKVVAPPAISGLRERANSWRTDPEALKAAEAEKDAPAEATAEEGATSGQEEAKSGGIMSGLVGGAQKLVAKAGEAVAAGKGMVLMKAANTVDGLVNKVEEPLGKVGFDICEKKDKELVNVFQQHIDREVHDIAAVTLVRGDSPYGPAEYEKVKKDALCAFLWSSQKERLTEELTKVVGPTIKEHASLTAWKTLIESYNGVVKTLEAVGLKDIPPISFNLEEYIVEQTIESLKTLAGDVEGKIRKESKGACEKFPHTFEKVFSNEILLEGDAMQPYE